MAQTMLPKYSPEYAKILAEVFAEVIQRPLSNITGDDGEITPSLLQALEYVYLHGPSSVRKVAEGLSITVSAASQLVDRLVHKQLATREVSESDRRLVTVNVTEEGSELVSLSRKKSTDWMQSVMAGMSAERQKALVDSLEEFIRAALSVDKDIESACVRCGIEHLAFCVLNKAYQAVTGEHIKNY